MGILGALGAKDLRGAGENRGALEELQGVQARAAGSDPYAMLELADRLVHGDMLPQNHAQVCSFMAVHMKPAMDVLACASTTMRLWAPIHISV